MSLLEVKDLSHSFGEKLLFTDSSFNLFKGEHMGLVGENGAGKSTLMKILLEEEVPSNGEVIWQRNIKIGYIDQYLKSEEDITIYEYLQTAYKEDFELEKRLNEMYEKLAEDYTESLMNRIGNIQETLEVNGFYTIDAKIDKVITGLGIDNFGKNTKLNNLSGGQHSKVILAKLLLENSDILLLDEPTNFLDVGHIEWLIEYLTGFEGAFIVISHNIDFLNKITNCICDIDLLNIKKYYGNYNKFLKLKEEYKKNYIKSFNVQQEYIKKTEEYIRRNKAGVNSKMARGRQKQLDRVERIDPPTKKRPPHISFEIAATESASITVKDLEVGYDFSLLPKLNMTINTGEKIVISGFNGIGKSTLLKTITGNLEKISGYIKISDFAEIGYYEQELIWKDNNLTALEIVSEHYPKLKIEKIRRELNSAGIEAKDLTQPIKTLSGGEQSKVKLCILMLKRYNILIFDEPTNHLDKETKKALREAIENFPGAVILVSHEADFYEGLVDKVYKIG